MAGEPLVGIKRPSPLVVQGRALEERLKLIFPPDKGFQHEFMPAKLTAPIWTSLASKTPFIGLGWNVIDNTRKQSRYVDGETRWSVYIVAKNQRGGFGARYFGDSQAHGLFDLVTAAAAAFQQWTIPGVGSVHVVSAGNAYAEDWSPEHTAMAMIELKINTAFKTTDVLDGPETELADWKTAATTWRVDGGAPVPDTQAVGIPPWT